MKINYHRFTEINKESLTNTEDQLSSFWIVQNGVEKYLLGEVLSPQYLQLLIDLGVLEQTEEELNRKNIVGPFKFDTDGSENS